MEAIRILIAYLARSSAISKHIDLDVLWSGFGRARTIFQAVLRWSYLEAKRDGIVRERVHSSHACDGQPLGCRMNGKRGHSGTEGGLQARLFVLPQADLRHALTDARTHAAGLNSCVGMPGMHVQTVASKAQRACSESTD